MHDIFKVSCTWGQLRIVITDQINVIAWNWVDTLHDKSKTFTEYHILLLIILFLMIWCVVCNVCHVMIIFIKRKQK